VQGNGEEALNFPVTCTRRHVRARTYTNKQSFFLRDWFSFHK